MSATLIDKLVKLENGRIQALNDGSEIWSMSACDISATIICNDETIQLFQNGQYRNIKASTVKSYQIKPAAPVTGTWTAAELLAILDVSFFDECCDCGGGGGSVNGAENGLYVAGGNVRLGTNPLIEETVIVEDGYNFTQVRNETIGAGGAAAAHVCAIDNPLSILGWVETPITRWIGTTSDLGLAITGATANNSDDAVAFMKQEQGDATSLIYVATLLARLAVYSGGVQQSEFVLSSTQATITADVSVELLTTGKYLNTDIVAQPLTGKYYFGDPVTNNSHRIGLETGSFAVQKYSAGVWTTYFSASPSEIRLDTLQVSIPADTWVYFGNASTNGSVRMRQSGGVFTKQQRVAGVWTDILVQSSTSTVEIIPSRTHRLSSSKDLITMGFVFDSTAAATQTFYTLAMDDNTQYAFRVFGTCIRTGSSGVGNYQLLQGARRSTVIGNSVSGTSSNIIIESLAGNLTMAVVLSGNNVNFTVTNSVATKTRFEGILEIVKTTIPDTF